MKSNIWIKIEACGLCLGLVGAFVVLVGKLFWSSFSDDIHNFFYGGEPGALVLSILILIGVISTLLFLVNFFFKRFSRWWLRFLGFIFFYMAIALIGSSGIT